MRTKWFKHIAIETVQAHLLLADPLLGKVRWFILIFLVCLVGFPLLFCFSWRYSLFFLERFARLAHGFQGLGRNKKSLLCWWVFLSFLLFLAGVSDISFVLLFEFGGWEREDQAVPTVSFV